MASYSSSIKPTASALRVNVSSAPGVAFCFAFSRRAWRSSISRTFGGTFLDPRRDDANKVVKLTAPGLEMTSGVSWKLLTMFLASTKPLEEAQTIQQKDKGHWAIWTEFN